KERHYPTVTPTHRRPAHPIRRRQSPLRGWHRLALLVWNTLGTRSPRDTYPRDTIRPITTVMARSDERSSPTVRRQICHDRNRITRGNRPSIQITGTIHRPSGPRPVSAQLH